LVIVPIILDQAVRYCFHYFRSGCWLLFPSFWIRLFVTVQVILDHAVDECSHYFGSGCFFNVPGILDQVEPDQVVGYCSHFLDQDVGYYSNYFA
jgi:hypothetical protein